MPTAREIMDSFYDDERIYMAQSPQEQDTTLLSKHLHPDIKLNQSSALPYAGTYTGVSGFLEWGKAMGTYFDKVDVHVNKIFEDGDDVISLAHLYLRVRRTGEELDMPLIQHIKVDREMGVLVEISPFYWDVAKLNEAVHRK